jgi:hypothetical protein
MAHYVSAREHRGHAAVRLLLHPLSRIAAFSADRAGLLAAGEFEPAAQMLARSTQDLPRWYPGLASLPERRRALEEFDRSRVVARVRSSHRFAQANPSVSVLVDQLIQRQTPEALTEGNTAATPPTSTNTASPASPPEHAGFEVPADAWPLARCDQRLTQRLGIL